MKISSLKDLPIEIDLGVEKLGHTPDYSKYGFTGSPFDLRRITVAVDGYQVTGLAEDGKLFIEMVQAPVVLNQKTLDAIEASEKDETEYLLSSDANADRLRASIAQVKS